MNDVIMANMLRSLTNDELAPRRVMDELTNARQQNADIPPTDTATNPALKNLMSQLQAGPVLGPYADTPTPESAGTATNAILKNLMAQLQADVKNTDVFLEDGKLTAKGRKSEPKAPPSPKEVQQDMLDVDAQISAQPWHPKQARAVRASKASMYVKLGQPPELVGLWVEQGANAFATYKQLKNQEPTRYTPAQQSAINANRIKMAFLAKMLADPESSAWGWRGIKKDKLKDMLAILDDEDMTGMLTPGDDEGAGALLTPDEMKTLKSLGLEFAE